MAKGKEALKSANRRYEAAVEHIDRLTDELAEAKARARLFEREATRAKVLDAEMGRLKEQLDAGTNDRLEQLQAHHNERSADYERRIEGLAVLLGSVMDRAGDAASLTVEEWSQFIEFFGHDLTEWNPETFHNRNHRRNSQTPGQWRKMANLYGELQRQGKIVEVVPS